MHKTRIAALAVGAVAAFAPAIAPRAETFWELEHARANARAGGPVSERDAELLERYGCLSGTKNAFCEGLRKRDKARYRTERKRTRE
jgi:hypothetical protein